MKKFLFSATMLSGAVAAGLCAISVPALAADNIVADQWYTASFGSTPSQVNPPAIVLGTDGPLAFGNVGTAIQAPTSPWVITMPSAGFVTFTDVETSGDQFNVTINGVPGVPTSSWLNPAGQPGQANGNTSDPNPGDTTCSDDIGCALGDANYSSGTFLLPGGTDTISAEFIGVEGNGDVNFVAEVPEPASATLIGAGLLGLGAFRRRRRKQG